MKTIAAVLLAACSLQAAIVNGSFEDGITGWVPWDDVEFAVPGGHTGSYCLSIGSTPQSIGAMIQHTMTDPAEYTLSFWAKSDSGTSLDVWLVFYESQSVINKFTPITLTSSWTEHEIQFTTLGGLDALWFVNKNRAPGQFVLVDDVSLELTHPVAEVPEPISAVPFGLAVLALAAWRKSK